MVRHLLASSLALGLVGAWLVLLAAPAHAACHIAGFVESEVEAQESAGTVSLVVELQGGVGSCAGTVDVATVDGTAVVGDDYEAVTATLTFEENDDRVETVDIAILADDEGDGGETFTVELSNPTGDITGTGDPATVTIVEGAPDAEDGVDGDTDITDDTTDDTEEGGGTLGIVLAVVAAIVVGVGAFVLLRGRGE